MIEKYKNINKESGYVGKITHCSTLKRLKSNSNKLSSKNLHGCPSAGSIIKTKRVK